LLQSIDYKWKDHLLSMDHLREGIYLRGYGQRDPLVEYQREGYDLFMGMIDSIREESLEYLFKIQAMETKQEAQGILETASQEFVHPEAETMRDFGKNKPPQARESLIDQAVFTPPEGQSPEPVKRSEPKVGRNAPCPCGSGKKYKRCCGK
ncbi:MAG: SEC-C metal-binding domain-containing protein, partial [Candidatus Omnitrophota bacterium]